MDAGRLTATVGPAGGGAWLLRLLPVFLLLSLVEAWGRADRWWTFGMLSALSVAMLLVAGWWTRPARVEVTQHGLRWRREWLPMRRIRAVRVVMGGEDHDVPTLVLALRDPTDERRVACGGVPREDVEWLAAHIRALLLPPDQVEAERSSEDEVRRERARLPE